MMNKNYPIQFLAFLRKSGLQRGSIFGIILLVALLAFEIFNYSTTDFALTDLLGKDLTFAGLRWATILSVAFCGIDFAGIARLFTPEQGRDEPAEVWYLFGAWILAAAMNAGLTWWGVAIAVGNHTTMGSSIMGQETMGKVIPVFVAVMVWIIRLLLIGTFAMAGERMFAFGHKRTTYEKPVNRFEQASSGRSVSNAFAAKGRTTPMDAPRPSAAVARPQQSTNQARPTRAEPTYHSVAGMSAKSHDDDPAVRR
jgi:hypothetical protein